MIEEQCDEISDGCCGDWFGHADCASRPSTCGMQPKRRDPAAHASCLGASWRNPTEHHVLTRKSWYEVQNRCPEQGRVVGKVDVKMRMDRTLHFDNGNRRTGEVRGKIRGIFCCADLSDLCSR